MGKIELLASKYKAYIEVPWDAAAAAPQRVVFCVYRPSDERLLRKRIGLFEAATAGAKHEWLRLDLTDAFGEWLGTHKYAKAYFKNPERLDLGSSKAYLDFVVDKCGRLLEAEKAGPATVVALTGVGSLFGVVKVQAVVERIERMVEGRLVVFFPGGVDRERNNYKLLDAYDGWNYHAVPITVDKDEE